MSAEPDSLDPAGKLDPERRLALAYAGRSRAPALAALWKLDAALAATVGGASQPMIAQIKLGWWRDALAGLDRAPAPAEPVLQAVREHLLTVGIPGAELAGLADGWAYLTAADNLSADDLAAYADGRGAALFRVSARLLGGEPPEGLEAAGRGWALVDLARHSSKFAETMAALRAAAVHLAAAPVRWPRALRPLGMLTMLARGDAKPSAKGLAAPASPGRMLRMLVHRLTGR